MPSTRRPPVTHYEIRRAMTGRAYERQADTVQGWHHLTAERDKFETLAQAVEFLRETYGTCKRVPMYRDAPDPDDTSGPGYRAGIIYCHRDEYAERDGWPYLQDWTEIVEVTERRISPPWRADPEEPNP